VRFGVLSAGVEICVAVKCSMLIVLRSFAVLSAVLCFRQVLGFASRKDAELWMNANPESTLGAVHFLVDNSSTPVSIKYSVQTNTTVSPLDSTVL
jgi:hypothetical protein